MATPIRTSFRRPLLISSIGFISLTAIPMRWLYLHSGEENFLLDTLNFIVVAIPFAFSIIFAFVPDMRARHKAWRALVIAAGLAFSVAIWKQQHLAADAARKDQQNAINTAIKNANEHTDVQISGVKSDLQAAKTDLGVRIEKLPSVISENEKTASAVSASHPHLTLDPGPSDNPKYAFETRFILTNRGALSMTDASYMCAIQNDAVNPMLHLNTPIRFHPKTFGPIEDLPSGLSRSLYCDFVTVEALVGDLEMPVVEIWVSYTYINKKEQKGFRFFAKRKYDDKTFVWYQSGAPQGSFLPANKP